MPSTDTIMRLNNTLRFWLKNRFMWTAVLFFAWLMIFCSGYDRELNLIFFFIGFCVYCLAGAYLTDNPNSAERLTIQKFMNALANDEED